VNGGRAAGFVLAAALLAGCGGQPAVTEAAGAVLTADVARLRTAATSGSSADVARAADRLRTDVGAQQAAGDLSPERAAAILDQLARVLADTAARPAPAPSPAPTQDREEGEGDDDGDDDEGKRKGKGKGR